MRYDAVVIGGGRSGCAEALARVRRGEKVCLVTAGLTLHALELNSQKQPYGELYSLTKEGVTVLRGDVASRVLWGTKGQQLFATLPQPHGPDAKNFANSSAPSAQLPQPHGPDAKDCARRALAVITANGLTLEAEEFVLATGRFFSKGLVADMDTVRESLFGADVDFPADRSEWFDPDFFAPQPFESFGVKTDAKGRILIGGKAVENVYAVGKILGGKDNAGK